MRMNETSSSDGEAGAVVEEILQHLLAELHEGGDTRGLSLRGAMCNVQLGARCRVQGAI